MIWSVWLLCWAGWWISTVMGVNIERQEANIAADSSATQLARFRYGRLGTLQYTIDHYASTSDGGTGFLANTTIVLTTEDSWASVGFRFARRGSVHRQPSSPPLLLKLCVFWQLVFARCAPAQGGYL